MGVKTQISTKDLPKKYQEYKLIPTKNGVSDSVYLLDKKYVVKIFENSSKKTLHNEITLLTLLKRHKVCKISSKKIHFIQNKPSLVYKKCQGKVIQKTKKTHIKQVGKFLKKLHQTTHTKNSSNKKLFTQKHLLSLIKKTKKQKFFKIYHSLNITLNDDGIIHGDLFVDNAIFYKNKLSCVIDFGEACNGDFYFDLAVVVISWCKSKKQIKTLLDAYGTNVQLKSFKKYIKYALLYYSVTRFLDGRDYKALLAKMDRY